MVHRRDTGRRRHPARPTCLRGSRLLVGWLLVGWLLVPAAAAQLRADAFQMTALSLRDETSSETRLHLYTRLPYTSLRFLTTTDGFAARYEMLVEAYSVDDRNRRRDLVQRQSWTHTVRVANFAATQLDHLAHRTTHTLALPPGRYLLECQVEDPATHQTIRQEMLVDVRDLSGPLALSDLMILEDANPQDGSFQPMAGHHVGAEQLHLTLRYELYTDRTRAVRAVLEVVRPRRGGGLPLVGSLFGLGRDDELVVDYANTQAMTLPPGRSAQIATIPLENLDEGSYLIRLRLEDERGTVVARAERPIVVEQWQGLQTHILDLASAIDQLKYIAKESDLAYIQAAPTEEERRRRFEAFWQRRDPTPGTPRNEQMMEYYYRVDYANRRYGGRAAGWQTDRGQVLVLFGQPDYVEQFDRDADGHPYQVWHYHRIGRRFIFIDRTGQGDYQLRTPLDDRTRIR
ncbi:MAG: GWxTD domain-containing protein [Bacteroidetes bacterium]|nr:MAG: GWxTD domain-containing protein [Bacteroidota bacterium]